MARAAPDGKLGSVAADVDPLDRLDELVRARRTSLLVDPDRPVPDDVLDRLFDLAVWAPCHKRTWPWRFAVFTGDGRYRLGAAVADALHAAGAPAPKVAKSRVKYARAPVVLLVWSVADDDPVRHAENRDAVAAAVQNLLLGATAAGLASHWASVPPDAFDAVRAVVGAGPRDELVGLVYLGWPTGEVATPERPAPEVRRVENA